MKKNLFKIIGFSLLGYCLANTYIVYQKTNKPEFTTSIMTTENGTIIHKREVGKSSYDSPIKGNYLIKGPAGKYMLSSNIKEYQLLQGIILFLAIVILVFGEYKNKKQINT